VLVWILQPTRRACRVSEQKRVRNFGCGPVSHFTERMIMAGIHDYLGSLVGEDGVSTLPDGVSDGVLSAYDADMSVPTAAIEMRDTRIAELEAELTLTKAANWDLLQAVPSADDSTAAGDGGDSDADSDPDNSQNDVDGDEPDIDSFFKDDE
jgi:hypothetical protein